MKSQISIRKNLIDFASTLVVGENRTTLPSEVAALEQSKQLMADLGDYMKYLEIIPNNVPSALDFAKTHSESISPFVTVSLWKIDEPGEQKIYLMQSPPAETGKHAMPLDGIAELVAKLRDGKVLLTEKEKHDMFIIWARDNYGHEGTMDFTEVMDRYAQSGEYPEEFNDYVAGRID